ncbi:MAG: biliverdin-producing heme oxygenase [Terrimesophilobacter sp.]
MSTTTPFSQALRERTLETRNAVGSGPFMRDLMRGSGTRDDYTALLVQHYFVYAALEGAAERMKNDPIAGPFITPALTRIPALTRDLRYLLGDNWRAKITPLTSTSHYVHRIDTVAATWNAGFVAHHYTRYLGDLSDGHIIRTLMQRQFGFDADGVEFYLFDQILRPKAFKEAYWARLDATGWSAEDRGRIVDEVLLAYRYATEVLDELESVKANSH